MNASEERVFFYHADANALGGVLSRPYEHVITTPATASLANAGGYNSSPNVPYHLDHILSCKAAYAHVAGSVEDDGSWTSLTTAVVEGINLLETVTADRIVAQISVKHPRVGYVPTVSFVGSQIVGLRINGRSIDPVLDLEKLAGKATAQQSGNTSQPPRVSFYHNDDVRRLVAEQSRKITANAQAPDWLKSRYGWLASEDGIKDRGYLLCSLVNEVRGSKPDETFGQVLRVPGFGNIFLGEVTLDANSFHLTMIRAEMGCAAAGAVSMASGRTNGKPLP